MKKETDSAILTTKLLFALILIARPGVAETGFAPLAHHPNIARISLFAENPDIVTPVGIAVDPNGRVFVQENHTHKRASDYAGPKFDRILIFEDGDSDGAADRRSVFYEGHTFSTDLSFGPDGHLYVSTRWFIGRFRDVATKDKATGQPEKLVECLTDGDYPHNGVGGLAIDPANPEWLAFGFGENLGVDYTFVGADGIRISGGGEGGSTYLCRTDGSQLRRQSTGHWNAFGMAFDKDGNLFSTDNDPNSTPPNRLLHIVPGADFGYEYRYGRSGRHPLVSWYGEIPGTLGMVGPLGEAACGVTAYGDHQLLTASWTDNRIDLHRLTPKGRSFAASRDPFISGPDNFRPVHFSYSPDGKYLYFSDWVKLDYPVHGHGRIWRVEFKQPVDLYASIRKEKSVLGATEALKQLGDRDPYVRTAAVDFLTRSPEMLSSYDWQSQTSPVARAHFAVALKRNDSVKQANVIPLLLADSDEDVQYVGIKWIADQRLVQYREDLAKQLDRNDISQRNLKAALAALAEIDGGSETEFSPSQRLLELAEDSAKPARLRVVALRSVDTEYAATRSDVIGRLAHNPSPSIQREAVRTLAILPNDASESVLREIAVDPTVDPRVRADAIAGLAASAEEHANILPRLVMDEVPIVAAEALRSLSLVPRSLPAKPPIADVQAWERLVAELPGEPDIDSGRRLFFHARYAGCYKCHAIDGRGHDIGPDLTAIHYQSEIDRKWLLHHVIDPNAEVAPYYRPQAIMTIDGHTKTGLILGKEGSSQAYVGADGEIFSIKKSDVEERREMSTSIMPTGLLDNLHAEEIRDLIAFLLEPRG